MRNARIFITGFMGSGKSTVARALARLLNCEAIDLDEVIAKEEQRSPKQIIEEDGETSFREIETRVLGRVLESDGARVVALGGGTWTLPRNRYLINAHRGISVWLNASFSLCWERILASGSSRPLASNEQETRNLFAERRASYELSDFQVEAGEKRPADEIAGEIAEQITRALSTRQQ